jgi:phosphoribosylpyrophosphate synthetase
MYIISCEFLPRTERASLCSVTAIADKLGVEFALIHRQRDRKRENAPERMEILVGDVKDKVTCFFCDLLMCSSIAGRDSCGRHG